MALTQFTIYEEKEGKGEGGKGGRKGWREKGQQEDKYIKALGSRILPVIFLKKFGLFSIDIYISYCRK